MRSKGIARLIFLVVFLIPVVWYLILQLFGDNNFALQKQGEMDVACDSFSEVTIVVIDDSLSTVQRNYFDRIKYGAEKRSVSLARKERAFFSCINQSNSSVVLVNGDGLWGTYDLSRKGVDELLTEMDILLLQLSYGKGTSR